MEWNFENETLKWNLGKYKSGISFWKTKPWD